MDKRARELARRVGAGEVLAEDADAALIRQGAFSDSAVELAALAGNVAAQAACPLPEFETLEDWLLEFNRFGHGVRVRICCAIAAASLADWHVRPCTCGHRSFVHLPDFGCVSCECAALEAAGAPALIALEAADGWLANPAQAGLEAAREAAHACSYPSPVTATAGYSLGGRPSFAWIEAALRLTPPLDPTTTREEVRGRLGDLRFAETLASEEPRPARALPPSAEGAIVFGSGHAMDAEALICFLVDRFPGANAEWVYQSEGSEAVSRCLGGPDTDWPCVEIGEASRVTWRDPCGREGVALEAGGGTQLRFLPSESAQALPQGAVEEVAHALKSIYWWARTTGTTNSDFELVLREVLGEGFSWSDLPGWEDALYLLHPNTLFNLFEDI